ncbi:MAG: hypothetical protein ACPGGA_02545, partial [Balneolaceae bacterium]
AFQSLGKRKLFSFRPDPESVGSESLMKNELEQSHEPLLILNLVQDDNFGEIKSSRPTPQNLLLLDGFSLDLSFSMLES